MRDELKHLTGKKIIVVDSEKQFVETRTFLGGQA